MFELREHAPSSARNTYKEYMKQLAGQWKDGTPPAAACQDMRRTLELRREHCKSLGLTVQQQFRGIKQKHPGIASLSYDDNVFVNHILTDNKQMTTRISSAKGVIFDRTENVGLSVVLQQPKNGVTPPPGMPASCPQCGAPSTLAQLENGCPYCKTHFLMDDLYPKVTNYFVQRHYDTDKKRSLRRLFICMAVFVILFLALIPFYDRSPVPLGEPSVIGSVFAGIFLGAVLWGMAKFLSYLYHIFGKGLRGLGKVGRSLFFRFRIKDIDPTFSSEHFRDRAMHLFRIVAHSDDPTIYTACRCSRPKNWDHVIDSSLFNFGVDRFRIRGQQCTVTITLYLDCLVYKRGRVKLRAKKVHMTLQKEITAPTALGFSVRAVSCPSCGGSFDAEQVKHCPYCGNEYDLMKHDWILTNIR